jgi:hypothetical protein
MAFLRFSRDKRGYEHIYLVQPSGRRGKTRARVLYWFRTPPNVRIGREPFDEAVRRALEAQYPDIDFDWKKFAETPMPQADSESWRERREVARATQASAPSENDPPDEVSAGPVEPIETLPGGAGAEVNDSALDDRATTTNESVELAPATADLPAGRRRRRRGRRGHRPNRPLEAGDHRGPGEARAPAEHRDSEEPRETPTDREGASSEGPVKDREL